MSAGPNKWITHIIAAAVGGAAGFIIPQGEKSELSKQVADLTAQVAEHKSTADTAAGKLKELTGQMSEQAPKLEAAEKSVGDLTEKLKQAAADLAEKSGMLKLLRNPLIF